MKWSGSVWGRIKRGIVLGAMVLAGPSQLAMADVTLPNIFSDHMVLQRDQKNKVWGKADAGEAVTVSIAGQ
jgi:sialate O-acetylesterase